MNLASKKLIQAQVAMYKFYLENRIYEKANKFFIFTMEVARKIGLRIKELPQTENIEFVINRLGYYPRYRRKVDSLTGKRVKYKLKNLHDFLYEEALKQEDGHERIGLYNLTALNGNAKALVILHEFSAQQKEKGRDFARKVAKDSKNGDSTAEKTLKKLLAEGDLCAHGAVLEQFLLDVEDTYYVTLLEEVSKSSDSPLVKCALAQLYYGRVMPEIGRIYTKGTEILNSKELKIEVEKLAELSNLLAQYYMGIIGKEHREYYTVQKWLGRAAIHYLPALHELGYLYEHGIYTGMRNTETDPEQAQVCYQKCAERGYARSQHALGLIAFHKKDFDQALYWLERSTAQGYVGSIKYLKQVVESIRKEEFQ